LKILVNYDKMEKNYLPILAHILREMGISAVSTPADLTMGELLQKAKLTSCSAILLINNATLSQCVPGKKPTLDAWRGSRLNTSVPIVICNKLAHVNTVAHGEWLLRRDLQKLRFAHIAPASFRYTVLERTDMFGEVLRAMQGSKLIAHDIETNTGKISKKEEELLSPDGEPVEVKNTVITCASWTLLTKDLSLQTFVLPLVDFDQDHWTSDKDYVKAIKFLQAANKTSVPKVMHNGMYDSFHCIRYHAEPYNYSLDTMVMQHSEFAELPKDLAFVSSLHLNDYIYWKDDSEQASKERDIQKYWGYNGKDTWHTMRVALSWIQKAPAYARKNYAEQFDLSYPALYCNFEGFRIDQEKRAELRSKSLTQLTKARERLQVIFADPNFNPGSWQQVEKYVYKVFGAKKPKIGKSTSGTDEKNLKAVSEQHPILARICSEIIDYREASKAIGTYFDFFQYHGRLLWGLNPFGTESGRMSCSTSPMWCGTQVQNVPSYAKTMLIADEGFEIFEIDNSQSEARCTAYCSQEEALIAALEDAERDFYRTLGTLFFNMPYEEVSDFFRNKVLKKVVHGTNYMMGAKTFIENIGIRILYETAPKLGITLVQLPRKGDPSQMTASAFAKLLLDSYHKPFPRVRKWYEEIYNEIKTTGKLTSPLGHVRVFFGDIGKNHNMLRGAVAHQPQNLSVTILNKGFRKIYTDLVIPSHGNFRLKAQVHDSILGQYRVSMRDTYLREIKRLCNNPVIIHGRTLVIPTDLKAGNNWAEYSESNPTGAKKFKGLL